MQSFQLLHIRFVIFIVKDKFVVLAERAYTLKRKCIMSPSCTM